MKLRRRVPDYTTPDWVHILQEGAGPSFGEKPLKTTENLGLGHPICPSFEKVWIRPRSTLKKNYRSIYVTRHDISRFMEVKRHKEKNVAKVWRCESGHLSQRQLHFLLPIAKDMHTRMLIIYSRNTLY